jgi:hypothetical protein
MGHKRTGVLWGWDWLSYLHHVHGELARTGVRLDGNNLLPLRVGPAARVVVVVARDGSSGGSGGSGGNGSSSHAGVQAKVDLRGVTQEALSVTQEALSVTRGHAPARRTWVAR